MDANWYNDLKVRKLKKLMGGGALGVLMVLYAKIQEEGYCIGWDDDQLFYLSDDSGQEIDYTRRVVEECVEVGLFDRKLFQDYGILTSRRIQLNFIEAKKRSSNQIDERFLLVSAAKTGVSAAKTNVNATETTALSTESTEVGAESTEVDAKSAQNKRKENKISPPSVSPPTEVEDGRTDGGMFLYRPTNEAAERLKERMEEVDQYDQEVCIELLRLSRCLVPGSTGSRWLERWFGMTEEEREGVTLKTVMLELKEEERQGNLEKSVIRYGHFRTLYRMMRQLSDWDYAAACSLIDGPDDRQAFLICEDCMKVIAEGSIRSPGAFLIKKLKERKEAAP